MYILILKILNLFIIYLNREKFDKKIKSNDETITKKSKLVNDIQAKLINAQRQFENTNTTK